jgi:hypothetical protein
LLATLLAIATAGGVSGCRPEESEARKKQTGPARSHSRSGESEARDASSNSRPGRSLPRTRDAKLASRIDGVNEELKKAMVALDRSNLKEEPVSGPPPTELGRKMIGVAKDYPDALDELGEYFARSARFVDLYARMQRKKQPVGSKELRRCVAAYNGVVASHNAGRLGLELTDTLSRPVDRRALDPRSYSHKMDRLAEEIHKRIAGWYRKHGGRAGVPVAVGSNEIVGFHVSVLRLRRRCSRKIEKMEEIKCKKGAERCEVFQKRTKAFHKAVMVLVEEASALAERAMKRLGSGEPPTKEEKAIAQRMRKAYRRVTGSRSSIL